MVNNFFKTLLQAIVGQPNYKHPRKTVHLLLKIYLISPKSNVRSSLKADLKLSCIAAL